MQSNIPSVLLAVIAVAWPPAGAGENPVNKVPLLELDVRALTSHAGAESHALVVRPARPARLRFETDWEEVGAVRVDLRAHAEPVGDSGALDLALESTLTLPDGRAVEATRRATVRERGTILFELYRHGERPFTLAITAGISETWEVVTAATVGARVRFDVEVLRVDGTTQTSLERNMLNTFVNETVRYEFRRGSGSNGEALTLSLTPVRLIEDLVEVKINVAGRLPGEDGVTVIARDENMVVNRGTTSPVTVTVGDPPSGYRFRVTPRF